MRSGLFPVGGGGGGGDGLSSVDLLGVGGRGGRLGDEELEVDWRTDPPNPAFRFPRKGGGVGTVLLCLFNPGTGGDPLLCRPDGMGLGVLGTGGGPMSCLELKSGLGGGIRFLCGSGAAVLGPEGGGPGNRPAPTGGEKGLADVVLPPGGSIGGLLPPESENKRQANAIHT